MQLHCSTLLDPAHHPHPQPLSSPSSMARTKLCRPQPALAWIHVAASVVGVGCHTHCPMCQFQLFTAQCACSRQFTLFAPGFSRGRCQDAAVQASHVAAPQGADMDKRAENTTCAGVWGEKKSEKGQTNTKTSEGEKCSSICFFPLCFPVPESGIKSINWQ